MVEYGVTETGFVKKDYFEISSDIDLRLRHVFGEDVDLTPGSPLKMLSDLFTVELTKLWTELDATYRAGFLNYATGQSLDEIGALLGIERETGTPATGYVTFKRTTVLPEGQTRIVPAGTIVSTSDAYPVTYVTTEAGYWAREIADEKYPAQTSAFTEFYVQNHVGEIVSITGDDTNDYTTDATFNGRVITLASECPAGVTLTIDYLPISISVPIQATIIGTSTNAILGAINILVSNLSWIHSVENENILYNAENVESDSSYRERIAGAATGLGNATSTSLESKLRNVTGVTNVIVKDFYAVEDTEVIAALSGATTVTVTDTPIYLITSVTGTIDGALTVSSFEDNTGEITFTPALTADQDVTVVYEYEDASQLLSGSQGRIKIYVSGGVVGDCTTDDTIVYTIENTRAAGIQSVGYNSGSSYANGVEECPFSWFYRIAEALIDVTITLVWSTESTLSDTLKDEIQDEIESEITTFINELDIEDKIWKNKLLQIAIGAHDDIDTATVDVFTINGDTQPAHTDYLVGTDVELPAASDIIVQR